MSFDNFNADVTLGGLRKAEEIKVLICLLVQKSEIALSQEIITNVICKDRLANYFDVVQAFSILKNEQTVFTDDNNKVVLSDKGKLVSSALENTVPFSVREKAGKALEQEILLLKRLENNTISVDKQNEQYLVTITIKENDSVLISITMAAKNINQVNKIKQTFLDDPTKVYLTNYTTLFGIINDGEE